MVRPAAGRRSIAALVVVCLSAVAPVRLDAQTEGPAKLSRMDVEVPRSGPGLDT